MITRKEIVQGYKGMNVPFTLLINEDSSKSLAIFLPGTGYTTESPLFHFSEDIFVNKNFDVLKVNYQYKEKAYDDFSMEELSEAIKLDVRAVVDKVVEAGQYDDFYVIGKSLGTIAMSTELSRDIFKKAKAVWLTPLMDRDDVFDAMIGSGNEGLCFIGDNDRRYTKVRYDRLMTNQNIIFRLLPDVNHSMEYDTDTVKSIDVLKAVIDDISRF
jgi:hypothetical protein